MRLHMLLLLHNEIQTMWKLLSGMLFYPYTHDWLEFNVPFQHKYGYIRDETHPWLQYEGQI